jgi:hypothetical protein
VCWRSQDVQSKGVEAQSREWSTTKSTKRAHTEDFVIVLKDQPEYIKKDTSKELTKNYF